MLNVFKIEQSVLGARTNEQEEKTDDWRQILSSKTAWEEELFLGCSFLAG